MLSRLPTPVRLATALLLAALATAPASGQSAVRVDGTWTFDADAVHPGGTIRGALSVRIQPDAFHVHSDRPLDEFLIPTRLSIEAPEGFRVTEIAYPKAIRLSAEFSDQPLAVFENEFAIGVALAVDETLAPGRYAIGTALRYQACDDKICLAPEVLEDRHEVEVVAMDAPVGRINIEVFDEIAFTGEATPMIDDPPSVDPPRDPEPDPDCDVLAELDGFTVLATGGGYLGPEKFIEFIDEAETGVTRGNLFEGRGALTIVALVLVGGIALNLTPCVLPLIPINLAIIGAGAQAGSRLRGFALGGTYGLAMAAVYGILGLVVILTSSTFGAINSTIWFNVAIAVLFVVLALAMFDLILIDFSKFQGRLDVTGAAKRGTFALAFGMGAVAALLAGACVAPVVIQVIVYSSDQYTKGTTIALALPFFLGLGMALPWPLAGAGLSCLPKPGMWMVRVKQAMGVFILAFAAYYAFLAWEIYTATNPLGRTDPAASVSLEGGWTASICDGLQAAKAENKPVLIDMWATWCKNCFTMDKTTFKNADVLERLDGYVKIKFQAEQLDAEPARQILERFNGIGLPTYAILRPDAGETASP